MSLIELPELIQGKDEARFRRFFAVGDPSACWLWTGYLQPSGYGKLWLHGKTVSAHKMSYVVHNGGIPDGLVVRHTCDVKNCVNPSHLLLGTPLDNARDAVERGLYLRGSRNGNARLSEEQVAEIRDCSEGGETQVSLASRFGTSRANVQWILKGRTWAGISEAS